MWYFPFVRTFLTASLSTSFAALAPFAEAQTPPAQIARLKIVVMDGEDAVNVIQQRTAVVPVVEVRDENDLPIAGVPVTFTVQGAKTASFAGGAQTLTVTTNAAGRAVGTGFTPVGSGTVQMNVSAVFQGQTATATITQTNFATAAQAAQAGKATSGTSGSGGGAAGGVAGAAGAAGGGAAGGGLSALTIAGIAAAAGAGALVATRVVGSNEAPTIDTVSASPSSALLGTDTPIRFSAPANDRDNDSLSYSWEFGDGGTSTEQAPTYIYRSEGTFTARVRVSDGEDTTEGQTTVTVRTLTGNWRSSAVDTTIGNLSFDVALFQSGNSLSGSTGFVATQIGTFDQCPVAGAVGPSSPRVAFDEGENCTGVVRGTPVIFSATSWRLDPGADINTLTGTWGGEPITLTRQ